jgi:WD40 repeat protein
VLKGHTKRITCLAVLKEEDTLASGSWDNDIIIWNIKDGGQIRILNGHTGYYSLNLNNLYLKH